MSVTVTVNDTAVGVSIDAVPRYYGAFYDTLDQPNAGATSVNLMKFRSTDFANGVSIVDDTKITIANAGVYNIQFSAQVFKDDGGDDIIDVWLRKNGNNVAHSNTEVIISGNDIRSFIAWNFLVTAEAGAFYQLAWFSVDTLLYLEAKDAAINPTRPAIPSVILTITQIA